MALDAPQKIHPKKEKRVTIKILNKTEAEIIRHQTKEKIVARIQQCVNGKNASHTVLAIRQLKSGDLIVHMDSAAGKKEIKK
jgi:predicted MarR family transcription regulator